jgi:hypothetical protein
MTIATTIFMVYIENSSQDFLSSSTLRRQFFLIYIENLSQEFLLSSQLRRQHFFVFNGYRTCDDNIFCLYSEFVAGTTTFLCLYSKCVIGILWSSHLRRQHFFVYIANASHEFYVHHTCDENISLFI